MLARSPVEQLGHKPFTSPLPCCRAFVEAVPSSDKIFVPLENGYHEVLLEDEGPAILEGMGQWILARAGNEAKM